MTASPRSTSRGAALTAVLGVLLSIAVLTEVPRGEEAASEPAAAEGTSSLRPLVIAHRGGAGLGPENTVEAARAGLEAGADVWELDTQLTKDGVPVLLHDDTLTRTTNAAEVYPGRSPWRLGDFTLAELKSLDAGSWWARRFGKAGVEEGSVSPARLEEYASGKVRIPTLEDALRFTRDSGWRVNVEIKVSRPGALGALVPRVLESVRSTGMVERVVISSFDHAVCRAVALSAAPRPRVQALTAQRLARPHLYVRDVIGADDLNPSLESLGIGGGDEAAGDPSPVSALALLRHARVGVNVWTVNDQEGWTELLRLGVTGVITDRPDKLRRWLASRNPGAASGRTED